MLGCEKNSYSRSNDPRSVARALAMKLRLQSISQRRSYPVRHRHSASTCASVLFRSVCRMNS